jgi:hypothetical protein
MKTAVIYVRPHEPKDAAQALRKPRVYKSSPRGRKDKA